MAKTLVRARRRLTELHEREDAACPDVKRRLTATPLGRLPVRESYAIRFLVIEQILYVRAAQKRTTIVSAEGEFRSDYTLSQLEALLPEDRFHRIHDSWLINLNLVECIHHHGNHSYAVQLANGMRVPVGRSRYAELLQCLHANEAPQ